MCFFTNLTQAGKFFFFFGINKPANAGTAVSTGVVLPPFIKIKATIATIIAMMINIKLFPLPDGIIYYFAFIE
jgi:hypothetical protein